MFFKKVSGIIFLFLLVLPFVSADNVNFKFYRDSYKPFETVQVEVKLENITLSKDLGIQNLVLYDQKNNSISLAKNIIKVDNNFYVFYFDVPQLAEGNYLFGLNDVSYTDDGISKFGDFFTNLNVVGGDAQILSVRPAYVLSKTVSNQEVLFTLIINNKGLDNVNVNLEKDGDFFSLQKNNFNLIPGASKNIDVVTSLGNNASFIGKIIVKYSDRFYEIPFIVERLGFIPEVVNLPTKTAEIDLANIKDPIYLTTLNDKKLESLDVSFTSGKYLAASQIIVKNNAKADLHDIVYSFSGNVIGMFEVEPLKHDLMAANGEKIIQIGLNKNYRFVPGIFSGSLDVKSKEGATLNLPINIEVLEVLEVTQNKTEVIVVNKSIEQPPVQEKGGISPFLVLFIIIVILLLILFFVYRRARPKQKEFEAFVERVKRS